MPNKTNRRRFLQTTAATGVGYWVAAGAQAQQSKSPNEQVAIASVGIGGKGSSDSRDADNAGVVVAICDIDEKRLGDAGEKKFPKAKRFTDFRAMLDQMDDSIDAVTVSTPDHCHGAASLMAMRMGKHCFTQKPMSHSIYEARLMGEVARETGLATQMGNQGTAEEGLRRAAAVIRSGALGTVKEVHIWTNRPIWPQGGPRPELAEIPEHVNWDLWLGPAPSRPYGEGYHPFAWRGWWDFGTGALGDMACHTMNMPYQGLDLLNPISVQAETSGHNKDSYPQWSLITYEFPENDWRPGLKMYWYDGGKRADPDLIDGKTPSKSGCVVIGEKGKLYSPNDYGAKYEILGDLEEPEVEYRKPLAGEEPHFQEWIEAIKGGPAAMSNFPDYATGLTETVLLGNLAVWVAAEPGLGEKVEWDAANLKSTNVEGLEPIVKPEFRDGYLLDV